MGGRPLWFKLIYLLSCFCYKSLAFNFLVSTAKIKKIINQQIAFKILKLDKLYFTHFLCHINSNYGHGSEETNRLLKADFVTSFIKTTF